MSTATRTIVAIGTAVLFLGDPIVPSARAVPGDIVFERQAMQGTPPAVFPHWFHRIRFRCDVCHPALFPMQTTGGPVIKMDDIRAGKYCGACHDGKTAWEASFDTCMRCHVGE